MNTNRPFSANSNKLAYAQAFSRSSTQRHDHAPRGLRRRSLTLRLRKTGV